MTPPPPHLVVDLSGHGYGHAGMTIPVLNALRRERPGLRLTLRTSVPRGWLAERLEGPFDHVAGRDAEADFGMAMAGAMRVLPEESAQAYRRAHEGWDDRVAEAAARLKALEPALLLSNIAYLPLAAARRIGVPAVAFCCLNWADVFRHYCGSLPGADAVWRQMADAYAAAELFLQPAPSMPMPSIPNGRPIGPVARLGRDRRAELRRRLGVADDTQVALLTLGGIPTTLACAAWPRLAKTKVILATDAAPAHPDVVPLGALDIPFVDVVRSCDTVITKTGYGTLTEAVCNGTPVLHVPRRDWPETEPLAAWIGREGRALPLSKAELNAGAFTEKLREVRALPGPKAPPAPTGIAEAVREIGRQLG